MCLASNHSYHCKDPFYNPCAYSAVDIFTKNSAPFLMCHMAGFMIGGLIVISKFNGEFSNMTIRKCFHLLALIMFLPGAVLNVKSIVP